MTEDEFKGAKKPKAAATVALRDFHIFCPPHADIKIKAGDDLSAVPDLFRPNLITEGVLKG